MGYLVFVVILVIVSTVVVGIAAALGVGNDANMDVIGTIIIVLSIGITVALQRKTSQGEQAKFEEAGEDRRRRIAEVAQRANSVQGINYMSGREFENFMAEFLITQGYQVEMSKDRKSVV